MLVLLTYRVSLGAVVPGGPAEAGWSSSSRWTSVSLLPSLSFPTLKTTNAIKECRETMANINKNALANKIKAYGLKKIELIYILM